MSTLPDGHGHRCVPAPAFRVTDGNHGGSVVIELSA